MKILRTFCYARYMPFLGHKHLDLLVTHVQDIYLIVSYMIDYQYDQLNIKRTGFNYEYFNIK